MILSRCCGAEVYYSPTNEAGEFYICTVCDIPCETYVNTEVSNDTGDDAENDCIVDKA
jgi:hypothetical protein